MAIAMSCLTLFGCGPIKMTPVLIDADVELETARAAGADKSAPYEYTAAETYLHQARVEAGYSQYERAAAYAKKAQALAKQAKEKAQGSPQKNADAPSEMAPPAEPPTIVPPAGQPAPTESPQ